MKWKEENDKLQKLILTDKLPYMEIGRMYGCSGSNIKKTAERIGIELQSRRKINPKEHFNKGVVKKPSKKCVCLNCGKEFPYNPTSKNKFCSNKCQRDFSYKSFIEEWKKGEASGTVNKYSLSKRVRRYLFEKYNGKCQVCGWGEVNKFTNKIPLQVHHIDGDCTNNTESNLQLLCPNCHSLTENFGILNKNAVRGRSKYFGKS